MLALVVCTLGCGRSADAEVTTPTTTATTTTPDVAAPERVVFTPRLGELALSDVTPPTLRPAGIPEALDALVKGAMEAEFERAPDDPSDPSACRSAIEVGYVLLVNKQPVLTAEAGEARAFFDGELVCPRGKSETDTFRLKIETTRTFGGSSGVGGTANERLLEALRSVLADGAANLFGQARMRNAPDADIVSTLATSEHPGLLAEAASEAGERKLVKTVPDLVRLTANAHTQVATRAGGALGLIAAGSSELATAEVDVIIRALVRMTDGPEPERHLVAINSLADLGTPDAKRYLESLAVGHPSAALREVAREHLRALGATIPAERPPEQVPEPVP